MNYKALVAEIEKKQSFLCVGLDTDLEKIPVHLRQHPDAAFEFNKAIIDTTAPYAVAFKPNTAFYECYGIAGWQSLEKTIAYIKNNYPEVFVIADAKRGDIGNTSKMYAKAAFEQLRADAVTVAPYMGEDSVTPFLSYPDKWVILLALTSNKGAFDFQFFDNGDDALYQRVLKTSLQWAGAEQMMYVVGATKADMLAAIRQIIPQHFLLVPGVGAQGGSLEDVARHGMTPDCGLLVNSSRDILYADGSEQFAAAAAQKAQAMQQQMAEMLVRFRTK